MATALTEWDFIQKIAGRHLPAIPGAQSSQASVYGGAGIAADEQSQIAAL